MTILNTFKRYEKKYMLNQQQYEAIKQVLSQYMQEDAYGKYTICNIYIDTERYDLIRTSLDKPIYKEKLRLRSYGVPGGSDLVFLELKKKYKGVVYKRRVQMTLAQAEAYLSTGNKPLQDSQILEEIDWFLQTVHPEPKVYLAYDRIALSGRDNEELRVTFDTHIRFREKDLELSQGDFGTDLLEGRPYLMEIKIPGTMPLWMAHMLAENEIYPISFSKYGTCYQNNLFQEEDFQLQEKKKTVQIGGYSYA